jgi:glutaconate CoA-transferase subunit A
VAELLSLDEAVATHVRDGDQVAIEGFTHLIPTAAGDALIRAGRRDLHVIKMTPDIVCDRLIGAGCVRRLTFGWAGNGGVGSLYRFRDAVENGWPRPLELDEHSHAGLVNRYVAGACGLPFAVLRGYRGTDLAPRNDAGSWGNQPSTWQGNPTISEIVCPFTGERLTAVAALNPDVTIIHAQRADRRGNVQLWGIVGAQKEAVLAARRSIVTVEEVVEKLERRPGDVLLPGWAVTAVAVVPGGAAPSYAAGYYERDNDAYRAWPDRSRTREAFAAWLHALRESV